MFYGCPRKYRCREQSDCKQRVGKATFMLLKSRPHLTILTSASVEELVAVTLAFTVLGMAGLTLLYNKI